MAFAAAAPVIAAGIGAISQAASAQGPSGMLQLQPNKWSNAWQDLGFGNTAAMMSALGNPMFANYLNTTNLGNDFKGMFGNNLSGMGFNPRQNASNSMGYVDTSRPVYNPMVVPELPSDNRYAISATLSDFQNPKTPSYGAVNNPIDLSGKGVRR